MWLDGGSLWFPALGVANPTIAGSVPVPTGLLTSVRATFQAIAIDQGGTMAFSKPTFVVLQ